MKKAKLHIGLVEDTIKEFMQTNHAPIAFIAFDLDYYNSTKDAFALWNISNEKILPRTLCYFDDIFVRSYCEWNGPMLAINEFNQKDNNKKIAKINGLRYFLPMKHKQEVWPDAMFYHHIFNHSKYNEMEL